MKTSTEVKNIYGAIIRMRVEIVPVAKNKSANLGKFSYRYATLDSVIDLLNLVVPKHGLGWIQTIGTEAGRPSVTTRIIHESGEWVEDTMPLPDLPPEGSRNANQELGASITYFKRYALSAMFGIATDEDTDGVAEARERKMQVKANARAASLEAEQATETPNAALSSEPTTEQSDAFIVKSTGDAAIDHAIAEVVGTTYHDQHVFTREAVQWLNGIIEKKTPREAMISANNALNKLIGKLEGRTQERADAQRRTK